MWMTRVYLYVDESLKFECDSIGAFNLFLFCVFAVDFFYVATKIHSLKMWVCFLTLDRLSFNILDQYLKQAKEKKYKNHSDRVVIESCILHTHLQWTLCHQPECVSILICYEQTRDVFTNKSAWSGRGEGEPNVEGKTETKNYSWKKYTVSLPDILCLGNKTNIRIINKDSPLCVSISRRIFFFCFISGFSFC